MRNIVVAMLLTACGGGGSDGPVPTCQQASMHFYGAGCVWRDGNGTNQTVDQFRQLCTELLATAPSQCRDDLDDWRRCIGGVTSPATNNADCDCSAEQEALLTCE